MTKTALILHGWPVSNISNHLLVKYLVKKGYKVIIPNLFDYVKEKTAAEVAEKIVCELKNNVPDLIVGFSMGGLVLPYVAEKYPYSKLIFVATGTYFQPVSGFTGFCLDIADDKIIRKTLVSIGYHLPAGLIKYIYQLFNPPSKKYGEIYSEYTEDMDRNIRAMKEYSFSQHLHLLDLIRCIDNTLILNRMKNKSLIYSGRKDPLMPRERGEELHKLLVNSKLIINNGVHFNVFGEKDLKTVDEFINRNPAV